jgi:hypothetical protein
LQSPFVTHATQASAVVSHTAVAPPHCALLVHCTHCPCLPSVAAVAHAGAGALQSELDVQPRHVSVAESQMDVAPEHFVSSVQATHWPYFARFGSTSQSGVAPEHAIPLSAALQSLQLGGFVCVLHTGRR